MRKIEIYDGTKTYMFPNGEIATKERMLAQFPAVLTFTHIIETDEAGEVAFAVQNLAAMCTIHGIDQSLTNEEKVAVLEEIVNTEPEVDTTATAEERIAAALEYQVLTYMDDTTNTTETA